MRTKSVYDFWRAGVQDCSYFTIWNNYSLLLHWVTFFSQMLTVSKDNFTGNGGKSCDSTFWGFHRSTDKHKIVWFTKKALGQSWIDSVTLSWNKTNETTKQNILWWSEPVRYITVTPSAMPSCPFCFSDWEGPFLLYWLRIYVIHCLVSKGKDMKTAFNYINSISALN